MEEAAAPILHKATVADGKGGSEFSESRKAMQAGIKVPWDKEKEGHPIATLSRRVYDYVNHVLDLNIQHNGQEDLMSIQYEGRGENDTEPDRYMPQINIGVALQFVCACASQLLSKTRVVPGEVTVPLARSSVSAPK